MNPDHFHLYHRHQRVAIFSIAVFLAVISGSVIFLSLQMQSNQIAEIRSRAAENTDGVQNQGLSQDEADGEGLIFESEEEARQAGIATYQRPEMESARSYLSQYERKVVKPTGKPGATPTNKPNKKQEASISYKVYPILFVAKDKRADAKNIPGISEAMQMVKRWYSGPLQKSATAGITFDVMGATTVKAPEIFDYYKCPEHQYPCGGSYDGIWGNIQDELTNLGYPIWEEGYIHMVFVIGAGGWAGATCWLNGCTADPGSPPGLTGFGIVGDWALDAISGSVNKECVRYYSDSFCGKLSQTGTVGHELGHTFGLWHPDGNPYEAETIMSWAYTYFPFISLLNHDKNVLWRSKFYHSIVCTDVLKHMKTILRKRVLTGQEFTASFSEMNYGYCAWGKNDTNLVLRRNNVWGVTKIPLVDTLYPAQFYEFSDVLTAPQTAGKYASFWNMQIGGRSVGGKLGRKITVVSSQDPTATPTPSVFATVTPTLSP